MYLLKNAGWVMDDSDFIANLLERVTRLAYVADTNQQNCVDVEGETYSYYGGRLTAFQNVQRMIETHMASGRS